MSSFESTQPRCARNHLYHDQRWRALCFTVFKELDVGTCVCRQAAGAVEAEVAVVVCLDEGL